MSYTKRYIEEQMERGIDLLAQCDIDYDYVQYENQCHYDWSEQEQNHLSTSHYELYTNGEFIVEADTLSDASYVKEFLEQHEGYSNIEIKSIEFPY
jgi:hypothetical protein